ncbi:ABC transporter ATP-binding protein [Stackebrandtia nassauensis]|uniref:ABC transporter related protein n=1 Tax=Stackebrandtia nassauensis (strain DSM 44728 / CIP 108903 / NRRL B-16338 / NBRC 102104 / LLR-40K-21) TaxID=446470 RepID=D3Q8N8_STANL|nr:ABC transporter ATP-binding protein [Stackebrandtia nassauensis]ADD44480.1 ABC transporter related protein [Stackebrandtia nassauensis DSM 44728]
MSASAPAPAREDDSRAVRAIGLGKRYGNDHLAVDGLDLDVPHGAVYGFLGPNGSGKTTTIRMLLGLIEPSFGRCELLGEPMPDAIEKVLPRVGTLVEGPAFHPYLSGRENLRHLDDADPTTSPSTTSQRVDLALDRVGLLSAARKRFRAYSLGMKQRLALAAALLRPRDLLILDEPTNGLDPQGTREVRSLISQLAADGATIMLSTHLLNEVEQICSHVGIMHKGKLKAQGRLPDLNAEGATRVSVTTPSPAEAASVLKGLSLTDVDTTADTASALLGDMARDKIVVALVDAGVPVHGFTVAAPGLEDLFVSLTGEGFDVSA